MSILTLSHIQAQSRKCPDCTSTRLDVSIFSDTPSLTCNERRQLRRPQSYMLEYETEMSASEVTNLHPELPITSKPSHASFTTAPRLL